MDAAEDLLGFLAESHQAHALAAAVAAAGTIGDEDFASFCSGEEAAGWELENADLNELAEAA